MAPKASSKTRDRPGKKAAKARQNAIGKIPRPRNRIFRYKDGLLSLKTPYELLDKAKANTETCPLLQLPQEITSQIWELILTTPAITFKVKMDDETGLRKLVAPANLSIRQTCRRIYAETATTFYASNVFDFSDLDVDIMGKDPQRTWHSDRLGFAPWLEARAPFQLNVIREIKIATEQYDPFPTFPFYLHEPNGYDIGKLIVGPLRDTFPALQKIHFSTTRGIIHPGSAKVLVESNNPPDLEIVFSD